MIEFGASFLERRVAQVEYSFHEYCEDETWEVTFASLIDSKLEKNIVNTWVVFTLKEIAQP